jgi:hypothetical protein
MTEIGGSSPSAQKASMCISPLRVGVSVEFGSSLFFPSWVIQGFGQVREPLVWMEMFDGDSGEGFNVVFVLGKVV